jgi:hypothetical protein
LTLTGSDYAGIQTGAIGGTGAGTGTTGLQTLKLNSAVGAVSSIGTLVDATSLATLEVTSTGSSSSATTGAIGGSVNAPLTSLVATAASKSTTTLGAVTGTGSATMTALTLTATGVSSKLYYGNINLGTSKPVTSMTVTADVASTFGGPAAGAGATTTVTTGTVTTGTFVFDDRSTISDGANNGEVMAFASAFTTLNLTIGESVTFTDTLAFSGNIATFVFATDADSSATTAIGTNNDISLAGSAVIAVTDGATGVVNGRITQNATGTLDFRGTYGNATVTGNIGDDTILGTAGNDSYSGGAGADTITGAAGNDVLTGGEGQDTIDAGAGNDSITLTESTQAADIARFSNDTKALATAGTGVGDDTGVDTLTGFDTTVDTLVITATGVVGFAHGTSTGFGTGATGGTATSTGASTEFSSTTFLLDFGSATAIAITDGVDMAINVSGQNASGVAPTTTAAAKTALEAKIQYNLTGTSVANVITGGALADTITGGAGADTLNGGASADTFVYSGASDSFSGAVTSGSTVLSGTVDVIRGLTTGDMFDFSSLANTTISDNASITLGTSIPSAASNLLAVITGAYDTSTGVFTAGTASATNNDIVIYYAGGTNATTMNSIVLLDITGTVTAAVAGEVLTLSGGTGG